MAQRMLDEKTRVTEEPPPPSEETDAPFHTDGLYAAREAIESDGETLGSQDTEENLSTISEEEEEEEEEAYEEAEKENIPPSRGAPRKRRSASSLEKTLTRPPLRKKSRNNADEVSDDAVIDEEPVPPPLPRKRRRRTNKEEPNASETQLPEPVSPAVSDLKAEILNLLVEIESFVRKNPSRRVSIRNRTRESITRQLHYMKSEQKLTKLKTDAEKILHLWRSLS
ncbi:33 kDa protein [Fowl aviadenovirus D]|uniref:33 kDa protein n=1 Tax=Fowl aviadenovirus D TaxID=190064 RepID=A0A1L2FW64_9ADEN|nr:33 kDa protein [Fowl aviadenovirus D]UPO24980.1 33 kDa protein [Fowl aviadenovirus D]